MAETLDKGSLMDKIVSGEAVLKTIQECHNGNIEHDFIVPDTISGTDPSNQVDFTDLTKREAYVAGFIEGA